MVPALGSIKRIQRHKARQGLCSVVVKRYPQHANYRRALDDKENILKRDLKEEAINQKGGTDITHIHVQKEGGDHQASVMEICRCKTIEYAYDSENP